MKNRENIIIDFNTEEPKFYSTLTKRSYYIRKATNGKLNLFDSETGIQVPSYDYPHTKKAIARQALIDLNADFSKDLNVNNLIRLLKREISNKK